MKTVIQRTYIRNLAILILLVLSTTQLYSNMDNKVFVSGQVTNYEYGNPVSNHPVYIESDELIPSAKSYSKVVYTDHHGYYYDTITTSDKKGSVHIYTLDHNGSMVDTTLHFRFLSRAMSVMIADFSIYLPYQAEDLQARFKYLQKVNGPRKTFSFIDQTQNDKIVSWKWDFGDGNFSHTQNPIHTYSDFGLYRVSLTVDAFVDGEIKKSVITKQLYIKKRDYFHLGGHVFSEHFPIDMGFAFLYLIDSAENYHPIDTMPFDTLGYYYFYQIPEGKYVIKAEPMKDSEYYGALLPTYFGNSLHWQSASVVQLSNTSWEYDIALEKAMGVIKGSGGISGRVEYVMGSKAHGGMFAEGVNIYLIDKFENKLTCHYSNETGEFDFNDIELNEYLLYPEVTGVECEPLPIELTDDNPVAENIEISILSAGINYIVPGGNVAENLLGTPYPNPAVNSISIKVRSQNNSRILLEVYDSYGRLVHQRSIDGYSDTYIMDVSDFSRGYYTIKASADGHSTSKQLIIAK